MTASYQHLALSQVRAGMQLSDELLDAQGHVLLPRGTVLSEAMLALMPRHGYTTLPIAVPGAASAEQQAAGQEQRLARIAHLFRHNDPDSDAGWTTALLRRFVTDYRLGLPPEHE